jgi:RimJ/RimL family protein N-acetyltransferase
MQTRINLREYKEDDLDDIYSWANKKELTQYFRFAIFPQTKNDALKFLEQQLERKDDSYVNFVIYDVKDTKQKYLGSVGLKNIDFLCRHAELTIVIAQEKYRGKGYGQEALYLICNYAFNTLNLNKVYLSFISSNKVAEKSYLKFGFINEGARRKHYFWEGNYYDEVLMSILRSEFTKKYNK